MQGRNRDTDREDRLVDPEREGEDGTNERIPLKYIYVYIYSTICKIDT